MFQKLKLCCVIPGSWYIGLGGNCVMCGIIYCQICVQRNLICCMDLYNFSFVRKNIKFNVNIFFNWLTMSLVQNYLRLKLMREKKRIHWKEKGKWKISLVRINIILLLFDTFIFSLNLWSLLLLLMIKRTLTRLFHNDVTYRKLAA